MDLWVQTSQILHRDELKVLHEACPRIRNFYLDLPDYAGNYTNFNCGHFATHYAANKLEADEVHMYGFDSLFDSNMRSYTDLVLNSDRGDVNSFRLIENWRPIWQGILTSSPTPNLFFIINTTVSNLL